MYSQESHPLHKVTIMPRGQSLGHTAYIPERERYHVTKTQLLAMMDTMMGGRAAEELIFGPEKITSGASSDLKQATSIASHMVKDWGMSEKHGLRTIESAKGMQPNETLSSTTMESVSKSHLVLRTCVPSSCLHWYDLFTFPGWSRDQENPQRQLRAGEGHPQESLEGAQSARRSLAKVRDLGRWRHQSHSGRRQDWAGRVALRFEEAWPILVDDATWSLGRLNLEIFFLMKS